jgi:hypothetical protein
MYLEARAESCFSSTFVLKRDGRAIGKLVGRWFSEGLDIQMVGRRSLQFVNTAWLGSSFQLTDVSGQTVFGWAQRGGIFTSSWDVQITTGPGQLVSAGFFSSGYVLQQDGRALAQVDYHGACERGWWVDADDSLAEADVLLVGLVYHVIRQRRNRQHSGSAAHGS